eukprot:1136722-Pelagomonas_calceolata.AAC.2
MPMRTWCMKEEQLGHANVQLVCKRAEHQEVATQKESTQHTHIPHGHLALKQIAVATESHLSSLLHDPPTKAEAHSGPMQTHCPHTCLVKYVRVLSNMSVVP